MPGGLSTHILDTGLGKPAGNVKVELYEDENGVWKKITSSQTDSNGRITNLLGSHSLELKNYLLKFYPKEYFQCKKLECFYPYVDIIFQIQSTDEHYHVPLLISSFGFSTYRGS